MATTTPDVHDLPKNKTAAKKTAKKTPAGKTASKTEQKTTAVKKTTKKSAGGRPRVLAGRGGGRRTDSRIPAGAGRPGRQCSGACGG